MQKSNSGFYAAAAVILTLASLFYAWKFILPEYQKTQGEIAQADKEISAGEIKLDSLQSTKVGLDSLGDLVDRLFLAVPEDKDTPNLITELEAIATKSKMYIPSIQISDGAASANMGTDTAATTTQAVSGLNPISISLSVTGDFGQLNQFLMDLEKDIRFTNVKSVTLSSSDEGMSLAVQMEVYKRAAIIDPLAALSTSGDTQNLGL
ncbi:MAG: type 4a pilus biogenesis protein PilO [Patescibacteria group bacterium]